MEHTPPPWKVEGATLIWAPDAVANIAQVSELRKDDTVRFTPPSISSPDFHEIVANAAFIVRAVNNHDALLSALEEVSRISGENQKLLGDKGSVYRLLADIARAAIEAAND